MAQISVMNPEIERAGGKPLSLGAYVKRAMIEYPSLRAMRSNHETLGNELAALRSALRFVDLLQKDEQLSHVVKELDRLLSRAFP